MPRYVALLRGINVGGNTKVNMAELRSWVTALGYTDVSTYINTGNVVFTVDDEPSALGTDAALAAELEEQIERESGLRIPVLVRSRDEIADAIAANPFPDADPSKLIMAFMRDEPDAATLDQWASVDSGDDEIAATGSVVYLHCPGGLGRSKLGERLLGRRGPLGTTRNLRTVRRLLELAG
ncbi:DUF1697 domain-containing protein [Phytoactinopolyspora alkaliphila]|uniref:DUF1697 domain-containing protein n=1 Tax=Phytoactinopolyspora alkaliphila TaxID=1783498 RepID=A0A6N9YLS4_9ACTN|nr:DUF1697 domain-containing protein [Phytoactinopolyspora alkaliphila]NED96021.1 DUF1697 domain-containing protein [Phytoactinopolyspora alkaliphila]